MPRVLRYLAVVIFFLLLTLITQCGGVIFLLALLVDIFLRRYVSHPMFRRLMLPVVFIILYAVSVVVVVPVVAAKFGRVPMPWYGPLRPENIGTCILNRHYVRPDMKKMMVDATAKMTSRYPGSFVNYFDANFPFYDGFPLWPHLSHNDGRKLDVGLFYEDHQGNALEDTPSVIGYGVFVDPKKGEVNYPEKCEQAGYWQYGLLGRMVSQKRKADYIFDQERTKYLVTLLVPDPNMQLILIEPHLKSRMNLTSSKIRFHGCHAVRHDDHIHIQLRK